MQEQNLSLSSVWPIVWPEDAIFDTPTWLYDNVFTNDEIEYIKNAVQKYSHTFERATVGDLKHPEDKGIKNDVRRSTATFLSYEDPELLWAFKRISQYIANVTSQKFRYNLSYIEPLQYTMYHGDNNNNDFYDWHLDDSDHMKSNNLIRKLSFSILLTEPDIEHVGGNFQLKLNKDDTNIIMKKGSILFFPSYVLHRVTPVTKGTRISLVGWINGPNWV